jgi:hypothetical protein
VSPAIKYDVSDVESGGGGEQPQPALYKGKIQSVTHRTKNVRGEPVNDLEVVVDVGDEFARLWTYIQLDNPATKWKLREFTDAMGLPSKGGLDPAKLKGKAVTVKVAADTDLDGNYRGRVKNLFKPGSVPDEDAEGDETPSGEEEPLTEDELHDWSNDDLKEELEARGLKLSGRFSSAKAIEAILEDQGEPEEAEAEESDGNGAAADIDPELLAELKNDASYYEDWEDDDIKSYIDDLGISGNLTGRKTRAKMIDHIVGYAAQVNGGSAAATATEDDYDEWGDDDLKDEINTRLEQGAEIKISGRRTKEKMIAALRADDSSGEPF